LLIYPDFIVDTVDSAHVAYSLLEKNSYNAIISDYFMPDMDGITFLRKVRSFNPYIPFIIFTGHGNEEVAIEAVNNGADFYLKKSYDVGSQFFELAQIIRLSVSRARSDEALFDSERYYRSLFKNMLEGYAYCKMLYDEQGNPSDWIYVDVNEAFEKISGLSQVKGKLVTEIIPGIWDQTPGLFEIYNRVVVSGIPETFELNFTPLSIWLRISVYKPKDGHFVAVFENITARKLSEERLKEIIRDQQTILENVPALIWFKDTHNRYLKVNPAVSRIFGRPVWEIEGKNFSELFPDLEDTFYSDDLEIIQSKTSKIGVLEELTTYKGDHLWVQSDKVPLFDDNGEVIGVLIVSTDITERKTVKDAISNANHKLNLLSGITRHDIGNELQIMFGYLGFVKEDNQNPQIEEYIDKIYESAHHIERQIAFTRDYQDIGVQSPIWQNVAAVITQAIRNIDINPIQFQVDISGVQVYADPLMIKVFFNLVDNAKRYGEKITYIRFFGEERIDGYVIICEDDGVGIEEKFKLKIFNREFFKHTGFGLNLSREILDITGITITETGKPGIGARFEILVPEGKYRFNTQIS